MEQVAGDRKWCRLNARDQEARLPRNTHSSSDPGSAGLPQVDGSRGLEVLVEGIGYRS